MTTELRGTPERTTAVVGIKVATTQKKGVIFVMFTVVKGKVKQSLMGIKWRVLNTLLSRRVGRFTVRRE